MKYRLPSGKETGSFSKYVNQWSRLAKQCAAKLGNGWIGAACDPGVKLLHYSTGDAVHLSRHAALCLAGRSLSHGRLDASAASTRGGTRRPGQGGSSPRRPQRPASVS